MKNGAPVHAVAEPRDNPDHYRRVYEDDLGDFEGHADNIMRDAVALAGHALQAYGRAVGFHDLNTICEAFTEQDGDNVRDICAKLVSVLDAAREIGQHSHKLRTGDE